MREAAPEPEPEQKIKSPVIEEKTIDIPPLDNNVAQVEEYFNNLNDEHTETVKEEISKPIEIERPVTPSSPSIKTSSTTNTPKSPVLTSPRKIETSTTTTPSKVEVKEVKEEKEDEWESWE